LQRNSYFPPLEQQQQLRTMARAAALLALVPFLAIVMDTVLLLAGFTTLEPAGARVTAIFFCTPGLLAAVGVSYLVVSCFGLF
jgi:hypothetical protein